MVNERSFEKIRPWCGEKAKVYTSGSFMEGWCCFVECSEMLSCGARGPEKRSKVHAYDEYELQDQVIRLWNTVS